MSQLIGRGVESTKLFLGHRLSVVPGATVSDSLTTDMQR
jgi:hypothetical protein